jgi:hypothetical protein
VRGAGARGPEGPRAPAHAPVGVWTGIEVRTLSDLYASTRALPKMDLGPVRSVPVFTASVLVGIPGRSGVFADADDPERRQILHGDMNTGNLRKTAEGVQVFDFDDCGVGPIEHDVGNALYMAYFDAVTRGTPDRYPPFRRDFLRGYADGPGGELVLDAVQRAISRRVLTLAIWLARPALAPMGVARSSRAWKATLQTFTETYILSHPEVLSP